MKRANLFLIFAAWAFQLSPASFAAISYSYWSSAPSQVDAGSSYYIEAWTEFTSWYGYDYDGYIELYRNGNYETTGYGSWSAYVGQYYSDSGGQTINYSANSYDYYGNYDWLSTDVQVVLASQPSASVVVDGYSSGAVINRPPDGSPVTITVRYRATDPDGNLTGIRPQIWKPSDALDNNGGAFVPQSGGSGEVVRTVVLNENGNWRFWTDAQDAELASAGTYVNSGAWNSGFLITLVQPPQSPNVDFTISATTAYIGQTLSLTSAATDVNGDLAFHSFWWDQGQGMTWTAPQFDYDYPADDTGWSNISNSAGYVANGNGQTITANWTAPGPGTYLFHSNAYDSRGGWGNGAVHTVVVQNRVPSGSYSILDANRNPLGLDANGRVRLVNGSQFFVRVSGTDPDSRLANLYSRVNNNAGAGYAYEQIAVSGSSASHDFGPYYANGVGIWDVWGHAQDYDGGWADVGSPDIEVYQPNRPPTVSMTVNGVSSAHLG